MKITKKKLRKIIKEEILNEATSPNKEVYNLLKRAVKGKDIGDDEEYDLAYKVFNGIYNAMDKLVAEGILNKKNAKGIIQIMYEEMRYLVNRGMFKNHP